MPKPKKEIMRNMRNIRLSQGRKRKEFYVTDSEHKELKNYLEKIRDNS